MLACVFACLLARLQECLHARVRVCMLACTFARVLACSLYRSFLQCRDPASVYSKFILPESITFKQLSRYTYPKQPKKFSTNTALSTLILVAKLSLKEKENLQLIGFCNVPNQMHDHLRLSFEDIVQVYKITVLPLILLFFLQTMSMVRSSPTIRLSICLNYK